MGKPRKPVPKTQKQISVSRHVAFSGIEGRDVLSNPNQPENPNAKNTGIDFNRIGSAKLSVTGSSFDFKSTDSSDLFTIRNSSDQVSIQFDDKVLVMGSVTGAPPTPVAGGLYYSGSDEWFLGYEN